ncbi:MAG TPA: thioredoxin fold domain-containing protein [Balneolaceae bacterium]|nr:thioredoxin fold domain-containing protein [Balneolaceae bacterium]
MRILPLYRQHKRLFLGSMILVFYSLAPFIPVRAQDSSITWRSMNQAQKLAHKNKKKVLVFVKTRWSVFCKKMEKDVFPRHAVIDSIDNYFYAVKLNITSHEPMMFNGKKTTPQQFAKQNHIQATPSIVFISEDGKKLGTQPGLISPKKFSRLLGFIGSGAYQKMDFQTYLERYVLN